MALSTSQRARDNIGKADMKIRQFFVDIHLQLLSQVRKRPQLLGTSGAEVRGEPIGWIVFIRHQASYKAMKTIDPMRPRLCPVRVASRAALTMREQALPGGYRNGSCLDFVSNCLSNRSRTPAFVEFHFAQRRLVLPFQ